ncbi:acetoacetate--CoA ligase [Sphingosinicella xenopeptidilytica]|uniref:Acetoacetate--CoA ligase n=1 Tax=Sphingosinicella xenopeptidilytica TaxID=364098 RepID=A0ABW3C060_SPHXN
MTVNEGDVLWTPDPSWVERTQMNEFIRWLECERGQTLADDEALWRWSASSIEEFWAVLWDYFEIISDGSYEKVLTGPDIMNTRWFVGARLNYAEHVLRREGEAAPDEVALHHSSEIRPASTTSWQELGRQVRATATRLRALGVRPGQRVVSYMPNVPETVIAMLAATAIGAVWSSASPEFGAEAVLSRFQQIEPTILLVGDGYSFAGKRFDRREQVEIITAGLPSLRHIIWLPYLGLEAPVLAQPVHLWASVVEGPSPSRQDFRFERLPANHPLWVLYSSGTTGLPKAITHSHVGMTLDQLKSTRLHLDLRPGQSMFFYTTTGWMMWNFVVGTLLAGASAVLYDGSPTWPSIDALWDLTARSGTTMAGASPTLVAMMENGGIKPSETHDLSRLKAVVLGGAPSTPATFEWLYANVKQDLRVINTSGGTDMCGALVGAMPSRPVRAAEMQGRMLGMAVEAWSDSGEALTDRVGELVVTRPFPAMPLFFWGDFNNVRFKEAYFSDFPGVWRHGDYIKITEAGGCFIYGRSDATLNRYGVRIGTSEVYAILKELPRVSDSLIVCCETHDGGFYMPLFVSLKDGDQLDAELIAQINKALQERGSPRHVPDLIVQAPAIPYTRTGKKMEIPVRKLLMGAPVATVMNRDGMADGSTVDWYTSFAARPEIRARFNRDAFAA